MAQSPSQSGNGGAEFVNKIVTDAKNVPDVMRLYGYLGASSEDGHERLYLSPDLAHYVEVPASAILHRMPIAKEQDPHGALVLWVRRDAALKSKMAPAATALAQYFAGAIQGAAAAAAGVAAGPAAAAAPSVAYGPCVPTTPQCSPICGVTPVAPCPTQPGYHSCGANCTFATPCPTGMQHSCAPVCTHQLSCLAHLCSPVCTRVGNCPIQPGAAPQPTQIVSICPGVGCHTVPAMECATHASACPPCLPTAPAPGCVPQPTAACGGSAACGVVGQAGALPQAAALPAAGYTQGCYLPPTPAYSCGCYHTYIGPCRQVTQWCTIGGACWTIMCV